MKSCQEFGQPKGKAGLAKNYLGIHIVRQPAVTGIGGVVLGAVMNYEPTQNLILIDFEKK
tara:strand:+ start:1988 stop:2167 length:180 start_codon:yes stop_codon:yes gene_type:complete